jgi:hypothetical protein
MSAHGGLRGHVGPDWVARPSRRSDSRSLQALAGHEGKRVSHGHRGSHLAFVTDEGKRAMAACAFTHSRNELPDSAYSQAGTLPCS